MFASHDPNDDSASPTPTPSSPPHAPGRASRRSAPPPRGGSSPLNGLLAVLVFLMAMWMLYSQIWPRLAPGSAAPRAVTPRGDLTQTEKTTIGIFESVADSVVFVTNQSYRRNWSGEVFAIPRGSGSGFVWDRKGHIVTNYHVIEGAQRLIVTLADGDSYDAEYIGGSQRDDIAVLRIGAPPNYLKPIPVGTSSDLKVGQEVFAIGNPFGFDQTLTRGIISSLNRDLPQNNGVVLHDLIQTDAAINPGNSGGPLLDSSGRLIGVNTAIISPSRASAGIGFAIPVDLVNELVPQLINHGKPVKPVFGFSLVESRIRSGNEQFEGVRVTKVFQDRPADKAGLQGDRYEAGYRVPGDLLLALDGKEVPDLETFNEIMRNYDVGDTVAVRVLRFSAEGNRELEVKVTLAPGPDR